MTKDLIFKESWYDAMRHLPQSEQKKVTMAILHYAFADDGLGEGTPPSITSGIPANQSRLPHAREISIRNNYHVHLNNNQWKEKVLSFTGVFMKG